LQLLTPEAVAEEVALAAFTHATKLVMALLSPAYAGLLSSQPRRPAEELCRETEIYATVSSLAAYAIRGQPLDVSVHEYLVSLLPLWSNTVGAGVEDVDGLAADAEPTTSLGLVICAARAREQLASNCPISAVQLAALAGLSATQIRLLGRNADLEITGGEIDSKQARRWLASRDVPGFGDKARRR
jgi:hypothetical protein